MKKHLSLILALILVLSFSSCGSPATDVSTESAESPEVLGEAFEITEDFVIYCTDKLEYGDALAEVHSAYRLKFGKRATLVNEVQEKTIIVGCCDEVASYYEGIHSGAEFYYVIDKNLILVGGGSSSSAYSAAKRFASYAFESGEPINVGKSFFNEKAHKVTSFTLNGVQFADYTLVYEESAFETYCDTINDRFYANINTDRAPKSPIATSGPDIILRLNGNLSEFEYNIYCEGDDIILESPCGAGVEAASQVFLTNFLTGQEGNVSIEIDAEPYKNYYFLGATVYFENQTITSARAENGLVLQEDMTETVAVTDGVHYEIRHYKDYLGAPVVAYCLICEPDTVSPVCGLPYSNTTLTQTREDIVSMAYSSEEIYGYDICGAVNGDLYHIDTDNHPCGYNYRNGVQLSVAEDPSIEFFAVMKDGSYFCGTMDECDESQIKEAVGGRYMLLRDGEFTDLGYGVDFGSIRHPRTAIGYDKEGRLYVVVVDGRQTQISNGASLPDLAMIFKELGATDAVNIDGGGSSTFVVKDYATGEFNYLNSPSDGSLRPSINSFQVVMKDK